MFHKFLYCSLLLLSCFLYPAYSQFALPSLAVAGGPIAGWHFTNVDNLNDELRKAGIPELPKGNFTLGGGGFIDIPSGKNDFLRFGGMGIGFTTHREAKINDTLSKAVTYGLGMGGFSFEYVKSFKNIDLTFGALLGVGSLQIDVYQYNNRSGNWINIWNELGTNSSSNNITRNFSVVFYSAQPQIGIGILIPKFTYLKLNAGYLFSIQGKWKVDNGVVVSNIPSENKANGFNFSLGVNLGLFFRDL